MDKENVIRDIPDIDPQIRSAIQAEKLAVFVGAGVSRLCGCKSWQDLAGDLIDACFDENIINYREQEHLRKIQDNRKKITISKHLFESAKKEDVFYQKLADAVLDKKEAKSLEIYNNLVQFNSLFLTTNCDNLLNRVVNRNGNYFYNLNEFTQNKLEIGNIFHIHGHIEDRDSLIFTLSDYIERYRDGRFKKFLEKVFEDYTVLFVGYGLEELDLLDYVLSKNGDNTVFKKFVLRGYFRSDKTLFEYDSLYYKNLGVKVISFSKDDYGYDQLGNVIKAWANEINTTTTVFNSNQQKVDRAIANISDCDPSNLMQLIRIDKDLFNYFFRKISLSSSLEKWFDIIYKEGLFNPANNPTPQMVEGGGYTVEFWMPLTILEELANRNLEKPNAKNTKRIKKFLNLFIKEQKTLNISNFHTDHIVTKLIAAVPPDKTSLMFFRYLENVISGPIRERLSESVFREQIVPSLVSINNDSIRKKIIKILFSFYEKDGSHYPAIDGYWLNKVIDEEFREVLNQDPDIALISYEIILKQMQAKLRLKPDSFNYVWIPTIEDSGQLSFRDRIDVCMVRAARICLEVYFNSYDDPKILEDLLRKRHTIYKRLALFILNHTYPSYKKLFWANLERIFSDYYLKHELFELLRIHSPKFSLAERKEILRISTSEFLNDKSEDNAYDAKNWLIALDFEIPKEFKKIVEEVEKLTPLEISRPGYIYYSSDVRAVPDKSPFDVETLETLSDDEIVKKVNQFKGENFGEVSRSGLAKALGAFTKTNFKRVIKSFETYLNLKDYYISYILDAFNELLKDGIIFDAETIIKIVASKKDLVPLWMDINQEEYGDGNYFVKSYSDFLQRLFSFKEKRVSAKSINLAYDVLKQFLDNLDSRSSLVSGGRPADYVLNSSLGRSMEAFVNLVLYSKREKVEDDFWDKRGKRDLTPLIKSISFKSDLVFSIGKYYGNFLYIDRDWTEEVLKLFFSSEEYGEQAECFASGYLFYNGTLYKDSYDFLNSLGFYRKAAEFDIPEQSGAERIAQHVLIAASLGWDDAGDNLDYFISSNNEIAINTLSSFIPRYYKKEEVDTDFVIELWTKLHNYLVDKVEEYEWATKCLRNLSEWLEVMPKYPVSIHDNVLCEVGFLERRLGYYGLLESIQKFSKENPKEVGEVVLKAAENEIFLSYPKDILNNILADIYEADLKDLGNKISNAYLRSGCEFVRETHEKYK